MSTIITFMTDNWHAILVGGALAMFLNWLASWLDGKGAVFIHNELEQLRTKMNENSLLSQIHADDALVDILEATIPVVLHDFDDTMHQTLAQGNIGAVNWINFGKKLWNEVLPQVKGGVNDYLKNSSFSDGEALAAYIAKRFFVTQKMSAKGLIVDNARAEVTDVTKVTVETVKATRDLPPGQVVTQDVHTEVKPGA